MFAPHHQASTRSSCTQDPCKGNPHTFPASRELSKKDISLLTDIFMKNTPGEDNPSEEVATCGDFGLARVEMHCLSPSTPISFKVINIVAAYLSDSDSESWYLPSFFGDIARLYKGPSEVRGWVASAIKTCQLKRFHRRLQQCSKIFIPLHDHMSDHWYLLVMNLDERTADILDSKPDVHLDDRRMVHAREAILLLQTVFSNEMTRSTDVYFHFPSFNVNISELNPRHNRNAESGIYVIRHMQYHGHNWSTQFDSIDHRNLIALEIAKHPRNHVIHPIEAPASRTRTSANRTATYTGNANAAFNADMALNGRKCRSHRLRRSRA